MTIRSIAGLALGAALLAAQPALAACEFRKLGELAFDPREAPTVDIVVGGKKGRLLINTGSYATTLTRDGAALLGVKGGFRADTRTATAGGEVTHTVATLINAQVGGAFYLDRMDVLVLDEGGVTGGDIVGSLGQDVLAASDVEFDLAAGRIAFFTPKGCQRDSLAYWSQKFSVAPTRRPSMDRSQLMTTVKINGRPMPAQIVTGGFSIVDRASAKTAGVDPTTPGVESIGTIDFGGPREAWMATFDSFAVGDEEIRNVKLPFASLFNDMRLSTTGTLIGKKVDDVPSVLLGLDFLRSHRVLIANSQGKMYFTYNGGTVFAKPKPNEAIPLTTLK
jgi:predicted aspartyl protease